MGMQRVVKGVLLPVGTVGGGGVEAGDLVWGCAVEGVAQRGEAAGEGGLPVDQRAGIHVIVAGVGEQGVVDQPARRGIGAEARRVGGEERVRRTDRERVGSGTGKGTGGLGKTGEVAIRGRARSAQRRDLNRGTPAVAGRRGNSDAARRRG